MIFLHLSFWMIFYISYSPSWRIFYLSSIIFQEDLSFILHYPAEGHIFYPHYLIYLWLIILIVDISFILHEDISIYMWSWILVQSSEKWNWWTFPFGVITPRHNTDKSTQAVFTFWLISDTFVPTPSVRKLLEIMWLNFEKIHLIFCIFCNF